MFIKILFKNSYTFKGCKNQVYVWFGVPNTFLGYSPLCLIDIAIGCQNLPYLML